MIQKGNLTPTEVCSDCRKMRKKERIPMSAKEKMERFYDAIMFVLFTLKKKLNKTRMTRTVLNRQFKYT